MGHDERDHRSGLTEFPPCRKVGTVLQVVPALEIGGVERGTVEVATHLAAEGWNAVVASSGGVMVSDIEAAGAVHVTLPLAAKDPYTMWRNVFRLEKIIRDHRVDIVHARSRAPAWSALMAARRACTPLVTTVHGLYGHGNRLKRLYNSVMTRGDRVIAVSNFVKQHLTKTYSVPAGRLRVVNRGVDLAQFQRGQVAKRRITSLICDWTPAFKGPVIMMPGRASRSKGHSDLVDAVQLLKRNDIRVLLVGADGEGSRYTSELRSHIRKAGLDEVVKLTRPCRDMPAAYSMADIVVSASSQPEAFGRVSVEAQAMECAVIATALGGSLETVLDGETGWLVPPQNPAALASALETALQLSPSERSSLGHRAREHVSTNFATSRMVSRTLAVYEELLDGR